jgi:hypothetical protein
LSEALGAGNLLEMILEFARLVLGLLIALFHQPLADFITEQDRVVVAVARRRGLLLPEVPSARICRNFYFSVGIFIALYELLRIWTLTR